MKIVTRYTGKDRDETHALTKYTAIVEFYVSDLEVEDGIEFEQWITENFMYVPAEIMADIMGLKIPRSECEECDCEDCNHE